jgi:AraC-like DNA-binding protein
MNPVNKALWFIESHYGREITLEEMASVAGVSRYHMSRAFAMTLGQPALRYTRSRRLSEAARALAKGAPDILSIALEAGYNSHEAFTRAFREQFGFTPESVRSQRHLNNIQLVEALKMRTFRSCHPTGHACGFRHSAMPCLRIVTMCPRYGGRGTRFSTNGCPSPAIVLSTHLSSSVMRKDSTRAPVWAALKSGCRFSPSASVVALSRQDLASEGVVHEDRVTEHERDEHSRSDQHEGL